MPIMGVLIVILKLCEIVGSVTVDDDDEGETKWLWLRILAFVMRGHVISLPLHGFIFINGYFVIIILWWTKLENFY